MLSGSPLGEPAMAGQGSSSGPSNFVWKYCRMCALEVRQGVYIFGEEGRRLQIPEKIRKTVTILVLEEDTLPKKICTRCCTSLEAYNQFKDSVVDAQEKLAAIARSIEKSQEQSIIHLQSRQYLKSPKRPKLYSSSAHTPPSGSHVLVPAPSFLCGDNDLDDPSMECDEPPSSVVSSEDEETSTNAKVVPECPSAVEVPSKDDDAQEPVQGSPPRPSVKQVSSSTTGSLSPPEINHSNSHQADHQADVVSGNVNLNSVGTIECDEETVEVEAHLVCGLCSVKVNDRDLLISHHTKLHNLKSNKDPVFGCSVCSRIGSNYDAIRQHIYRHRMFGAFKCADCDKSYSTKDQLDVHISSKHNPVGSKAFSCSACGKLYSTNIALAAHTKKKHAHTNFSQAKQETATNPKAANGTSSKPNSSESLPPASSTVSTSNSEQQSNQSSSSSSSQTKATDSSNVQSGVSQPQASCSNDLNIQQDANNISSDKNKDEKDGYWKCNYCEKILYSKHGYETHVSVHKGRRFTCEYCGVCYTQRPTLEHHIKVHHTNADTEFECPECNKHFKTFRQLGWHKKTHEKPLSDVKCPQCEKKFLNMISLKTHMKLHRGSKNFPCQECPKSFYTKQKLEEHMNSHTGRRPFGCPTESCTKVFSCFSNYAKHFKKHHYDLLGPRGSMIPQPKMIEANNNSDSCKSNNNSSNQSESLKTHLLQVPQTVVTPIIREQPGGTASLSPSKSQPLFTTSNSTAQSQTLISTSTSTDVSLGATMTPVISQQTPMSLSITKPTVLIFPNASNSNVCNQSVQTSSLSSTTAATQAHSGCLPLVTSNNNNTLTLHSSNISTNESPSHQSSSQHQSVLTHGGSSSAHSQPQPQAHHHSSNVHSSSHSIHAHQPPHSVLQSVQHMSHQQHNPVQSVWQPVILPGSKNFHHGNSSSLPSLSNSLDLMDCAGTITAHQSDSVSGANHSHGHPGNLNVIQMHAATAHHSTPSHPSHLHHSVNSSSNNGHHHLHPSHHSSHSHPSNNIGSSSSASTVTVPTFVPSSQQNEPMELSYKIDSNNFQEMPMELTKVFTQRDPLELCVRQDFAQPGMDLSSRVVNVTVGGNPSISVSSMSMNMNGSSNNPNSYGHINSGGGSSSTSTVLSIPYHKTVEMERELSLNDFTGAFRQPIDLIARTDEQSHELCSEGNLVDLSLRSSFGQDHSASSFLRELIDLSSRSETFHGEINLTNKQHHQSSHPHSQLQHSHSSGHHSISKGGGNSSHHHHHHSHHNNHHHHHPPPESSHSQSSSSGGTVVLQNVMYQDAMFSLQN